MNDHDVNMTPEDVAREAWEATHFVPGFCLWCGESVPAERDFCNDEHRCLHAISVEADRERLDEEDSFWGA